jgi:cytochrome c biogenesis factor
VILTAVEPDGSATVKIHHNPLVNWGWAGGVIFVLGCVIVLWPHPQKTEPQKTEPEARSGSAADSR